MNGTEITETYFHEVFTQKGPKSVSLAASDKLQGLKNVYELQEPIGKGAVGQVWSAKDLGAPTVSLVAVKVMLPREDLLAPSRHLKRARPISTRI